MAHHEIKFEGLYELQKVLEKNISLDRVKELVEDNGLALREKAQAKADFKKGYQTGTTKRSIGLEMKDNGLTAEVAPTTEYSAYLEFGTRYMDAQPYLKPAWDEQKELFKRDMQRLCK